MGALITAPHRVREGGRSLAGAALRGRRSTVCGPECGLQRGEEMRSFGCFGGVFLYSEIAIRCQVLLQHARQRSCLDKCVHFVGSGVPRAAGGRCSGREYAWAKASAGGPAVQWAAVAGRLAPRWTPLLAPLTSTRPSVRARRRDSRPLALPAPAAGIWLKPKTGYRIAFARA